MSNDLFDGKKPSVNAHATYTIGLWGKCKHFVRAEDGKAAAPHNHQKCTCPECQKPKAKAWYKCVMTEKWLEVNEVHLTHEQGG